MKKTLLSLKGTKKLSREELKKVNGGAVFARICCEYEFINGVEVCTRWVPSGHQCP